MPENSNQSKLSNYSLALSTNESIDTNYNITGDTWSVSYWIKIEDAGDWAYHLSQRDSSTDGLAAWSKNTDNKIITVKLNNLTDTDAFSISAYGEWNHICFTSDGTTLTSYLNGSSVSTLDVSSSPTISTTNTLKIGLNQISNLYYLNGSLSEWCVFDYTLSTDQVTYLYNLNNPMAITGAKPVVYYSLGDNSNPNALAGYPNDAVGGSVFDFDSSNNEYIDIGVTPKSLVGDSNAYTVSAWVNPDTSVIGNNFKIIGAMDTGNRWYFRILNGYASYAYGSATGDNDYQGTDTPVAAGAWSHVMFTFDGSTTHKIYVNGDLKVTQSSGSGQTVTGTKNLYLGALNLNGAAANYFNGFLSNIVVWNTDQSSEITNIYNNGIPASSYTSTPTAWWKLNGIEDTFDGSNWTIKDFGSGGNDGTSDNMTSSNLVQSNLSRTTPYSNYSIKFNGATQWFSDGATSGIFNGATSLSISGWMNVDPSETTSILASNWLSGGRQYLIRWNLSGGGFQFYLYLGTTLSVTATITISSDTWYHVAGTWDGSTMKIYVNGVLYSSTAASGTLDSVTSDNLIGKYSTSVYADGKNSNIAFWKDTALTFTEIREIYNAGIPTDLSTFSGTAPTRWYPMDQRATYFNGSSLTIRDTISNNDMLGYNNVITSIEGNAPGSNANGTGANLDISNLKGDMSGSTKNSYSINMADYGDPNSQGVTPANSGRTTSVPG